jgi:hypothetical protein
MTINRELSDKENKCFVDRSNYNHLSDISNKFSKCYSECYKCRARIVIDPRIRDNDGNVIRLDLNLKRHLCNGAERILHELNVVDEIKNLFTKANEIEISSFQLRLVMEEEKDKSVVSSNLCNKRQSELCSNAYTFKQHDKVDYDFIDRIFALSDDEFCKLVIMRMNIPQRSKNQLKEDEEQEHEYWTEECLVDETFLQIAGTKEIIKYRGKSLTIYKYYNQALRLLNWIPIAEPTPEFIINISDLTPRIIAELQALKERTYNYITKQAVGRIFENIDFRQYHLSIARKLKVRLDA